MGEEGEHYPQAQREWIKVQVEYVSTTYTSVFSLCMIATIIIMKIYGSKDTLEELKIQTDYRGPVAAFFTYGQ